MHKPRVSVWLMGLLLVLSLLCTAIPSRSATTSGSLNQNEEWSGTIDITDDVTVPSGLTLKIDPGTVIRFANNTGLNINGRLDAIGSAEARITFTSAATGPTQGIWKGIYFYDPSLDASVIDQANIEWASRGLWCGSANPSIRNSAISNSVIGIYLSTSSPVVSGCSIDRSRDYGIYIEGISSPQITNNHIARSNNGIHVAGYSYTTANYGNPVIQNNIIRGNVGYGIRMGNAINPTIRFNTLHANGTGIYLNIAP